MKTFNNFGEALAEMRLYGGAMSVSQNNIMLESDTWFVGDYDEIAEIITGTVREATETALTAGGMSPTQIQAELTGWTEPIIN